MQEIGSGQVRLVSENKKTNTDTRIPPLFLSLTSTLDPIMSTPAFLAPTPVTPRLRPGARVRPVPHCCAQKPPPPKHKSAARALPAFTGSVAGALAFVFLPFAGQAALAAQKPSPTPPAKELRYDGRHELDGGEKAMSLTLTAGTFATLGIWAWKQNRRDDELENVRIKEEVERLDKLKAEFLDVEADDESLDDEDLLASLKQRIGDTEEEGDKEDSSVADEAVADEAVAPDAAAPDTVDADGEPGADSVDMLKRMWEATDEEQKGRGKKP